jgi:hypothetical protein
MRYLLPCSCGQSVSVEFSQAGGQVRCACGKVLDVPSMRAIRQLEPAAASPGRPARARRSWSPIQGVLFAVGLLLMAGGLGHAGYLQIGRLGLPTQETDWDNLEVVMETMDSLTIDQTWEVWNIMRDAPIGPYSPPDFIMFRRVSAIWLRRIWISLAVAAGGFMLAACALVIGPRAKRPAGRPARVPVQPTQSAS